MQYRYKALKKGKIVTGRVDGESEKTAIEYLKNSDYFPIEVKRADQSSFSLLALLNGISFNDIVDLTRQLSIMLTAGLTLIDAFDILKLQITKPSLLAMVLELDKSIRGGTSFSESLKRYPQYFSNLYIALVRSGEASGKLSEILLKLADNLEKQREFASKIKGALIYPALVVSGMIIVMFIMMTFVLPKLLGLFKDFNADLPFTTKVLIVISNFLSHTWPLIIIGAVGLFVFLRNYFKSRVGKYNLDKFALHMPVVSKVIEESTLVASVRTLSVLIGSGVSILEALNIVIDTTSNIIYQDAFKRISLEVERGTTVGQAMKNQGIFPPILIQMTIVGEQTGHLDETLGRIARYFEYESETAIKAMTTLIEPAILVVLGISVGFLVMSVISPIYQLSSSIK